MQDEIIATTNRLRQTGIIGPDFTGVPVFTVPEAEAIRAELYRLHAKPIKILVQLGERPVKK